MRKLRNLVLMTMKKKLMIRSLRWTLTIIVRKSKCRVLLKRARGLYRRTRKGISD